MKKYEHIFFDLDHTLWDFEKNAEECLQDIYVHFELKSHGAADFKLFFDSFSVINRQYWTKLENKEIEAEFLRKNRFKSSLSNMGVTIDEATGLKIDDMFIQLLPSKSHLMEGTINLLETLAPIYPLHIISNGWYDIQIKKMKSSGIVHYFEHIVTHEKANARKPDKEIFEYALDLSNAKVENSIMIGDSIIADIQGALSSNIDTIFYNSEFIDHDISTTYEVNYLSEIPGLII
jgi:YjjG family noncanonical pyrimidine nucleotidase